jgi:hypothetical protein
MGMQPEQIPEFRSCGARWRTMFSDPHWTCHGTGLVKLMDGPHDPRDPDGPRLPVVAPASALPEVMAEEWADVYRPEPFAGGDHVHWCAPPAGLRVSGR